MAQGPSLIPVIAYEATVERHRSMGGEAYLEEGGIAPEEAEPVSRMAELWFENQGQKSK